jgi:ATP-dependent DNA helicase RecQ
MTATRQDKLQTLKKYFGYDSFRAGQEEVIDALLSQRDVLCVMPTGAGKSVCYQIPALLYDGVTIVVSPLISLMKDQVQFLVGNGVRAAYVNSSLTQTVIDKVLLRIRASVYKIIYVAPERLATYGFLDAVKDLPISQLIIDESHCISKWGHDFRPSYLNIIEFVKALPRRPVIGAFTATATDKVKADICQALSLKAPLVKVTSFDRPNLFFDVRRPKNKEKELLSILKEKKEESGIVYCATRKTVEKVCDKLLAEGYAATRYHAGLENEERTKNQDEFIYDKKRIMVATNAFGMGIDKGNVSFVVHYNMPKDMESYYQEAGRAGRDGKEAECILLFGEGDIATNKYLIECGQNEEEDRDNQLKLLYQMVDYCKTDGCLRQFILGYFGESHKGNCDHCGNCIERNFEVVDVSAQAKVILDCMRHLPKDYGISILTDVLRGGKGKNVTGAGLDGIAEYGALSEYSREEVTAIADKMLEMGILARKGLIYPALKIVDRYCKDIPPVRIKRKKKKERVEEKFTGKTADKALFTLLKNVRTEIAKRDGVPAYIVFSDATLTDMCAKKPTTRSEFLAVSGVGEVKCDRYGSFFLAAIQSYLRSNPPQE